MQLNEELGLPLNLNSHDIHFKLQGHSCHKLFTGYDLAHMVRLIMAIGSSTRERTMCINSATQAMDGYGDEYPTQPRNYEG